MPYQIRFAYVYNSRELENYFVKVAIFEHRQISLSKVECFKSVGTAEYLLIFNLKIVS